MNTTDGTGAAAIGGGLLMAASVAAELVHHVEAPDGTVVERGMWTVYLTAFVVGAALLVRAAAGVDGPSRAARLGRVLNTTGAALVLVSGLLLLPSGALTGTPLAWGFVPFALGLLLSGAGALTLGAATRELPMLVIGVGALVAVLTQPPLHDVGLLAFLLGWAALGALRLRQAPRRSVTV
jgi:hypothetical protein